MQRFFSMVWFQTKLYAKDQYFFWLMITSTVSMFITLYLVNYVNGNFDNKIWLRAAIVGLWSSATTSAGAISFQKYQQTLDTVLNQKVDEREALSVLVLPATIFGFLAFPVSHLMTLIFGISSSLNLGIILGGILLFISVSVMSLTIAIFFVLTSDAIIYEQLIDIPIVLLAGVFGFPNGLEWLGNITSWLIPITGPVRIIMNQLTIIDVAATVFSTSLWASCAWLLSSKLIRLSKRTGRLGEL